MFRFTSCLAVLATISGVAIGETVIDDFSDGWTYLSTPGSDEDGGLASAIGGVRRVEMAGLRSACWVNHGLFEGQAHLEVDAWDEGEMTLSYGNKTFGGGELNLNWRSGGNITLRVTDFEETSTYFLATTIHGGGTEYVHTQPWEGGDFVVPLSSFPELDLSDVDGLRFHFAMRSHHLLPGHVTLSSIGTDAIPEPSTLALLAMGVVALLAYALRKRRR